MVEKILKGNRYLCISPLVFEGIHLFRKGKIYECTQNDILQNEVGGMCLIKDKCPIIKLFELVDVNTPIGITWSHATSTANNIYSSEINSVQSDAPKNNPIHPQHYQSYSLETIDMMEKIWGAEKTAIFCELNAFKYRQRLGNKDDFEQDLKKEKYYLDKAKELRAKL